MTHLSAETRPATGARIPGVMALLARRSRLTAIACIAVLTLAGWAYLLLVATPAGWPGYAAFIDAICSPASPQATGTLGTVVTLGAMWVAMTLAMMLPTAGPMILTYAEIAETAARKGMRIVPPHVLIAGYLAVWFGFAAFATLAQFGLLSVAALPSMSSLALPASALLFLAAGLYQFSALKQACLSACQRPFSFFFLNWTDRTVGVFRLGLRQGLYCLGCCWAMMLLMFVAGAMNAVWMAMLGLVMLTEKMTMSRAVGRAVGIAFTVAGLVILGMWGWGLAA